MGKEKNDLSSESEQLLIEMCTARTPCPVNEYSQELVDKGLAKYVNNGVEATNEGYNYYISRMKKSRQYLTAKEILEQVVDVVA
jgi:hypothetical protein